MLVNRDGLVFTGKRRDRREPPWQMPQGGIQDGETPRQAVIREVKEELGIDGFTYIESLPDWLVYDYPSLGISRRSNDFRGQKHLWFLLRFDGEDRQIRIDTPHGEFADWRWCTPAQTIDLVIAFKQPIYREVLRHFAPAIERMAPPPEKSKPSSRRQPSRRLSA